MDKLYSEEDELLYAVLSTELGKQLFKHFEIQLANPSYVQGDTHATAYNEGRRSVFAGLINSYLTVERGEQDV